MERYKNLGGDSGVSDYKIGDDSITVQFSTGEIYLYTLVVLEVHTLKK